MVALGAAAVYFGVRIVVEGDRETAMENADRILRLERALSIDVEVVVQDHVVDQPILRAIGNLSYVWLHWPLLIGVLVVLFRVSPPLYLRLRNTLIASSLVGLVLFTVFPAAPPRFMPGYEGTVSDAARRHYLNIPASWTNQVASFPSFHVGWTLMACVALATVFRHPLHRAVVMIPAVLVSLAVVTTGNHYVVDAVAGVVISVGAWVVFDHVHPNGRETEPMRTLRSERAIR